MSYILQIQKTTSEMKQDKFEMINMSDQHIDPIHFSVNTIGWKIYNELTIDVRQLNSH